MSAADMPAEGRREFLQLSAGAALGLMAPKVHSAQTEDPPVASAASYLTPNMARAWQHYQQVVEELQALTFNQPWMRHPSAQAAGHLHLAQMTAVAYNTAIAPRQHYPEFRAHLFAEPMVYHWGLKTPDFLARFAYVDGARTYRIWGKRGNSSWFEFTSYGRFITEPYDQLSHLGTWDLDTFAVAADGSFEIVVSAAPHEGNWIRLDPASDNNALHVRELIYDWAMENPSELHIELADGKPGHLGPFSEAEMILRLRRAENHMRTVVERFVVRTSAQILARAGVNAFDRNEGIGKAAGTNPNANYPSALYEIAPGEALIIETEIPKPRYWNLMAADAWMQDIDYIHHQSSLNGRQAQIDGDGKLRAVLALEDPGVPNWLDPIGNTFGYLIMRWYFPERLVIPTIRKVPVDRIRDLLPKDTPRVTPEQRAQHLRQRARAGLRRFGY